MEIHKMYEYINKKDESFGHFVEFIDFMFENKNYINSIKNETDRGNFVYHFDRIPVYLRDMLEKLRFDVLGDIADAGNVVRMISEKANKFTKVEKPSSNG